MKLEKDGLVFSTGKSLYANHGIIGLSPQLEVYEGYDGWIWDADSTAEDFTVAERRELAEHMIQRWTEFLNKHGNS